MQPAARPGSRKIDWRGQVSSVPPRIDLFISWSAGGTALLRNAAPPELKTWMDCWNGTSESCPRNWKANLHFLSPTNQRLRFCAPGMETSRRSGTMAPLLGSECVTVARDKASV